jgi:hypothetical protein
MEISRGTWLATVLVFVIVGLGLMLLIEGEAKNRAKACAIQCKAEGKRPFYVPPGTMGQTVESGSESGDWRMAFENCRCVSASTGTGNPPRQ